MVILKKLFNMILAEFKIEPPELSMYISRYHTVAAGDGSVTRKSRQNESNDRRQLMANEYTAKFTFKMLQIIDAENIEIEFRVKRRDGSSCTVSQSFVVARQNEGDNDGSSTEDDPPF